MSKLLKIGVPTYNREDLLKRMLRSIDHPSTIQILDNSPDQMLAADMRLHFKEFVPDCYEELTLGSSFNYDAWVTTPRYNMGVAASWNYIIKSNIKDPYWLIVSDDVWFAPGDLAKIVEAADVYAKLGNIGKIHCFSDCAFVMFPHGVRTVGWFDENFYPAYCEDCDWNRRADLLGVKRVDLKGLGMGHGEEVNGKMEGSRTVNATPELAQENAKTYERNIWYYIQKWGGRPGEETFLHPFNNPVRAMSDWQLGFDFRRLQQWSI
jgi:GT2 family glycosyltransferase